MKTKFKTRDLTMIAMMGAICCILLHIDFPLPFLPPFMNFDLKSSAALPWGLCRQSASFW